MSSRDMHTSVLKNQMMRISVLCQVKKQKQVFLTKTSDKKNQ